MSIYPASIDDNDPAFFYSPGWELITKDGLWTGTMHSTDKTGAFARIQFTGSVVAVICTIPTGDGRPVSANFTIDDGPPTFVSHASTPSVQFEKIFWDSGPLPMGNHLLTITHAGPNMYLRVNRVDYDPTDSHAPRVNSSAPQDPVSLPAITSLVMSRVGDPTSMVALPSSSTMASSSNSQAATSAPNVFTLIQTVLATVSPSTANPTSTTDTLNGANTTVSNAGPETKKTNLALIVGRACGAVAVVLRRRPRRKSTTSLADGSEVPQPFLLEPQPIVSSAAFATTSLSNRDIKNLLGPFDNTHPKSTSRRGSLTNPDALSYAASPSTHHAASNPQSSAQISSPFYAMENHSDPFLEAPPPYQAHLHSSNMLFTPRC